MLSVASALRVAVRPSAWHRLPPALATSPPARLGLAEANAVPSPPASVGSCRAWHRAPGLPWKIYHPHIQKPEGTLEPRGSLTGPARYVPKNLRHAKYIESVRTGEYLGPDWPYNFLPGKFWHKRRYNVTYHNIAPDLSATPGVMFFPRLNVWNVEWFEGGKQRFRWFFAQYGFMRAKLNAEEFRAKLAAAGRIDNVRTERHARVQEIAGEAGRVLRMKKKFLRLRVKDARRRGNSGTKGGPEKRVRDDYKKRGVLL